jgi:hypothetical protein
VRLSVAALLLSATWLAFLIHYPYPIFPYLVVAVLAASLWRLRAGALCLLAALAILAVTIFHVSAHPWRDGWDDLLAFSRLPPPRPRLLAVNEIISAAIAALSVPEPVRVDWSLAPDLPLVIADAQQIEQAVANLGLNALQAMPQGGCLRISTRLEGENVAITVCDTGPGIPEELRERVFEPFFSTKVTGTGLGLPLVREIALAHGGDLSLQSPLGEGACFTLVLPLAAALPRPESLILPLCSPPEDGTEEMPAAR